MTTKVEKQGREGPQICSRVCLVEAERPSMRRSPPPEETEKGLKEETRCSKPLQKPSGRIPPPGPQLTIPSLLLHPQPAWRWGGMMQEAGTHHLASPRVSHPARGCAAGKACKAEKCLSRLQPERQQILGQAPCAQHGGKPAPNGKVDKGPGAGSSPGGGGGSRSDALHVEALTGWDRRRGIWRWWMYPTYQGELETEVTGTCWARLKRKPKKES